MWSVAFVKNTKTIAHDTNLCQLDGFTLLDSLKQNAIWLSGQITKLSKFQSIWLTKKVNTLTEIRIWDSINFDLTFHLKQSPVKQIYT